MNQSKINHHPRSKRRIIVFGSAIIILGLIVFGVLAVMQARRPAGVSSAKLLSKSPAIIGSYRYVNACQVVPPQAYKQAFGYAMTASDSIENTYAEGSHTKLYRLTGDCLSDFGDQTVDIGGGKTVPGSIGTIRTTLYQYTDPKLASYDMRPFQSSKGQDVDLSALGIDDTITTSTYETITVGGTNVYNNLTTNGRFYFAYKNISASFDVSDFNSTSDSDSAITPAYIKTLIPKLVPIIKSSIDNAQLTQAPLEASNVGKPVVGGSSAKIINPCDYFTATDFKTITGNDADSTQVNAQYRTDAVAAAKLIDVKKSTESGLGDVSCQRKGYIASVEPSIQTYPNIKDYLPVRDKYDAIEYPVIKEAVRYFNNDKDAVTGAKSLLDDHTQNYADTKNTTVSGLGNYAAFSEFTISSDVVDTSSAAGAPKEYYLYVAHGPYLVSIQMYYTSGKVNVIRNGSDAQMKQAAQLLINRLPS